VLRRDEPLVDQSLCPLQVDVLRYLTNEGEEEGRRRKKTKRRRREEEKKMRQR
jgi:hypothetical protein